MQVTDLGYDLTFSTEIQEFGVTEVRDLIPDGRNHIVSIEQNIPETIVNSCCKNFVKNHLKVLSLKIF